MSSLTFNGGFEEYGSWNEGDAVTIDTTMTEADFSGKKLGITGAQILVAFMSTKLFEAKGSLSSLDISQNNLTSNAEDMTGIIALSEALPKW